MNIYNISARESFVDVLANHFLRLYQDKPEELSNILFLLPNRRACQSLAEAFVRIRGMQPTILPRIEPISDTQEEEVFLCGNSEILQKIAPGIDNTERTLIFTKLILQKNNSDLNDISLAQAYALAKNLADLIDTAQNEELNFSRLKNIVPEEYSEHWQQTLKLLEIITSYWPQILKDNGLSDPVERKKQLLKAELEYWQTKNQPQKIVIAGSTAAFPYLKEAVKTVAGLKGGEVYLYGLDKYCNDETWQSIDENHPQYELKALLDCLQIKRDDVENIGSNNISLREKLVSEIMRPALVSGGWRNLSEKEFPAETFENIHLINCDDVRQEAKAIALIMRETIEIPEKNIALVTSDRNLSRRVVSELKKWNINADDSAGQPLSLTHIGIYFRLIGEAITQNNISAKITLMKYPFVACGMNSGEFKQKVYRIEESLRKEEYLSAEQNCLLDSFTQRIRPLEDLYANPTVKLKEMLIAHLKVAESLADTDVKSGDKIIWKKDDGHAAAEFFADFINKSEKLGEINTNDYLPFLTTLLSEQNVRTRYGFHPRIKILGPIEARLTNYDRVIIGEANEGVWPKLPQADMWMSRSMKDSFGMSQAEKDIGIAAADFAHLLNMPEVYITRAQKADGAPTDKSRWWLRFETVLDAVYAHSDDSKKKYAFIYQQPYSGWAKNMERCAKYEFIKAPRPCPKVKYRPRRLSASQVEILMRDPYSIYAKKILRLQPLKPLDSPKEALDFGKIIHSMLEEFNTLYNGDDYPEYAAKQLLNIGLRKFDEAGIDDEVKTFWRQRLQAIADKVVSLEKENRTDIKKVHCETEGKMEFNGRAGAFLITATADRIDELKDGSLRIIDYKTGKARSKKEIEKVTAPQLPIEGMIAQEAGFENVPVGKVSGMQYWSFKGKSEKTDFEQSQNSIIKIKQVLQDLIDAFDDENRPYLAKPILGGSGQYGDYDHLSRLLEWSVKDDSENNGGSND